MKRALLNRVHPELDAKRLARYRDLFTGGEQFEKNIKRYLLPNDQEPADVYERRCKAAHYVNYCKPIAGYFASLLFSKELAVRVDDEDEQADVEEKLPPEDGAFLLDVDGKGATLPAFLARALLEALQTRSSYFRVDFPQATGSEGSAAEWERSGASRAVLSPLTRESLINWRCDAAGWVWVMHYQASSELLDPAAEKQTITETWTCYYRDGSVKRWQQVRLEGDEVSPEDNILEVPAPFNPTGQIPIVELGLPDDLWMMGELASPQLEHFRKRAGLSWSIERTCYAMPVFNLKNAKKPPRMGTGYYLILGVEDKASYLAPPDTPYEQIAEYSSTLKDEIHRVSTTMARGVDNNAAAVGRSGESKTADEHATVVVLKAYGRIVMQVAEIAMRMRDRGLGLERTWKAEGLNNYNVDDAKLVAESAMLTEGLRIPSVTFRKRMFQRVANSQIPNLSPEDQRRIAAEIEENVTPEDVELLTKVIDPQLELDAAAEAKGDDPAEK